MDDVSIYKKIIRNLLGSMKPLGSNLNADTRRYKSESENGKRLALSRKRPDVLNIWQ